MLHYFWKHKTKLSNATMPTDTLSLPTLHTWMKQKHGKWEHQLLSIQPTQTLVFGYQSKARSQMFGLPPLALRAQPAKWHPLQRSLSLEVPLEDNRWNAVLMCCLVCRLPSYDYFCRDINKFRKLKLGARLTCHAWKNHLTRRVHSLLTYSSHIL